MNFEIMEAAIKRLRKNSAALMWLETYGTQLTGKDDHASVEFSISFASAQIGAHEAARILEVYAKHALPDLVREAIDSCRETISTDRAVVIDEASK